MTKTATRIGNQRPRLENLPADIANQGAGDEVIDFAKSYGLILDDWQRYVVRNMFAEQSDNSWAATQSVLLVPRQAGKSALLEAVEMAALFLWDYEHIIYSAHLQKTSTDHMRRLRRHIQHPSLRGQARLLTGRGDERVELNETGAIIEFITRGKKTSRGGSPGLVIFDEALFLQDDQIQAMLPALSAQSMNEDSQAQMIYTSSAPIAESTVLHRLRKRAIEESPRRMYFAEWSVEAGADPADRDNWYRANPGLGVRISEEWIEDNEYGTLSDEAFGVERLGIPEMPPQSDDSRPIPLDLWADLLESGSVTESDVAWALAMSEDRKWTAIGVAGRRADGKYHVGMVDNRPTHQGSLDEAVRVWEERKVPLRVHVNGAEGSVIAELRERGVEIVEVSSADVSRATGALIDAAHARQVRHRGFGSLDAALERADVKVSAAGASSWVPRRPGADLSPLKAVTVALGGVPQEQDNTFFAGARR